ncbi:MAG: flagellar export chaperone FliS [Pseudomonadales bacterium]
MNSAIAQYRKLDVQTAIDGATPHKLVDMLLDGAQTRLRRARACIEHRDFEGRSAAVNSAMDIISALQASLDHDRGGDLSGNLEALYDYMTRRLFRANADNDLDAVREVLDLLATLHEAWRAIGDQIPQRQHA